MDSPPKRSLDAFLTEWQDEITGGMQPRSYEHCLLTAGVVFTGESAPKVEKAEAVNVLGHISAEDESNIDSPAKRQALSVSSKEPPLLLVLPAGRVRSDQVKSSQTVLPKVTEAKDADCLVDTLIADLVKYEYD